MLARIEHSSIFMACHIGTESESHVLTVALMFVTLLPIWHHGHKLPYALQLAVAEAAVLPYD
jgi:hypothetical protein